MKGELTVRLNGNKDFTPELKVFNGGEVNVCIPDRKGYPTAPVYAVITAQILDSEMLIALLLLNDALRRKFPTLEEIGLKLPYAPYARQDRVCNSGESLTVKVFTNLINSCNFSAVKILDPHSDVVTSLINKVIVEDSSKILREFCLSGGIEGVEDLTLVSPDFGATKKVEKLAKELGHTSIIQGTKERDLKTGALSGFGFYGDVKGKDLLIVDDICDGGGTFVGLTKELEDAGCRSISLYVTHGIFSRGVNYLLDNGIDRVYTTNSLPQEQVEGLEVIKVI